MNAWDLCKEKVAYNQWANRAVVEWLQQQASDLYEEKVVSSFPTINKLMHHIMEAEKYYFSILQKREEEYEKVMSTEKICTELLKIDENLLGWLSVQDPEVMDETISLKRSPFIETYSTATILTHMVNHSTYHRGQLVALRHQLGMSDAPKTDYYRYLIAQSQKT